MAADLDNVLDAVHEQGAGRPKRAIVTSGHGKDESQEKKGRRRHHRAMNKGARQDTISEEPTTKRRAFQVGEVKSPRAVAINSAPDCSIVLMKNGEENLQFGAVDRVPLISEADACRRRPNDVRESCLTQSRRRSGQLVGAIERKGLPMIPLACMEANRVQGRYGVAEGKQATRPSAIQKSESDLETSEKQARECARRNRQAGLNGSAVPCLLRD